ncbi:hypothetical protein F907_00266 [Acinetobacter colistiniresistens]|uniref:Gamma-glutamylcyclotransferase AIG2-like domain-containing protein n=2 Tax=Acinetobacter colistiniresistens TaxID=280145 RepID=S3TIF4_9GAMM|nr:hypothetical protein F907_00266 [Acinetobacter colistiniresistens]
MAFLDFTNSLMKYHISLLSKFNTFINFHIHYLHLSQYFTFLAFTMLSLFVYGTLGPNRPNAHIMENIGGTWADAHVFGTLKQQGWGAELGFPGIVLEQTDQKVSGFVFFSDNLEQHWQALDEFEGAGYQRVPVKAHLSTGEVIDSFVYALNT